MIYFGKRLFALCCMITVVFLASAQEDTTRTTSLSITPRFNSAGHFPFTGSLLNKHVNFDVNIFYEHGQYGFFLFKSIDLEDRHSYVNYFQPGIFRRWDVRQNVQVRLFFGYVFSQTKGFRDKDSDYYTATTFYWSLLPDLKIENTALFFDLSQASKLANRFLVHYTRKGYRLELYAWHRWEFEKQFHAISASVALVFPDIKISKSVAIQNSISYQGYLSKSRPLFALPAGLLVSIAFPIKSGK